MIRVLLDTNVILDYLLDREPFAAAAAVIWQANDADQIEVHVSAITPVNVFYIARKLKGANEARRLVESLLTSCRVCCPSRHEMQLALALPLKDFEDAVQIVSASSERLDAVVTRDPNDYMAVNSPIFSPVDFLVQFNVV